MNERRTGQNVVATEFAGGADDPPRGPLDLWVAQTSTGKARKLLGGLNTVFDECVHRLPPFRLYSWHRALAARCQHDTATLQTFATGHQWLFWSLS